MKKILFSLLLIGAVVAAISGATLAYFSDTVNSNSNTFTSGTLALQIKNDGGSWTEPTVNSSWESPSNWAPGEVFTDTIQIKNDGSIDAKYLGIDWQFAGGNLALADKIQVVTFKEYVGTDWNNNLGLSQHYQTLVGNGDDVLTLRELMESYIKGTEPLVTGGVVDQFGKSVNHVTDGLTGNGYDITPSGTPALAAGGEYQLQMAFKFMEDAGNAFQNQTMSMNIAFTGYQDLSELKTELP